MCSTSTCATVCNKVTKQCLSPPRCRILREEAKVREAEERKRRDEEARLMAEQQRRRDEAERIQEEKEAQEKARLDQEENDKLQKQVSWIGCVQCILRVVLF